MSSVALSLRQLLDQAEDLRVSLEADLQFLRTHGVELNSEQQKRVGRFQEAHQQLRQHQALEWLSLTSDTELVQALQGIRTAGHVGRLEHQDVALLEQQEQALRYLLFLHHSDPDQLDQVLEQAIEQTRSQLKQLTRLAEGAVDSLQQQLDHLRQRDLESGRRALQSMLDG